MGASDLAQPAVTEHATRTGGYRLQHEGLVAFEIGRVGQGKLENEFIGARPTSHLLKTGAAIQRQRGLVFWRDEQPHAATTGDLPQPDHRVRERQPTITAALVPAINRQPAQPPAGCIPQIGMENVKPDQAAACRDGKERVGQTVVHGRNDSVQRAQKAGNLLRIQFEGAQGGQLVATDTAVTKGPKAPK